MYTGLFGEVRHVNAAFARMEGGRLDSMSATFGVPWLPLARLGRPWMRLARARYLERRAPGPTAFEVAGAREPQPGPAQARKGPEPGDECPIFAGLGQRDVDVPQFTQQSDSHRIRRPVFASQRARSASAAPMVRPP